MYIERTGSGLRAGRVMGAVAVLSILAGCSSMPGGFNENTFGNLLAYNSPNAPPVAAGPGNVTKVDCPAVDVAEGGSTVRSYAGGQSNSSVRYQYSMGDLARDCVVENGQIVIKVGVEGKVLLGPAGSPSSFTVPVKISVRRESDEKIIETKVYRVAATIPAGSAQTAFSIVADPIRVPFIGETAYDDYQIFVGFEGGSSKLPPSKKRRRG